jgi:hypothetical protein
MVSKKLNHLLKKLEITLHSASEPDEFEAILKETYAEEVREHNEEVNNDQ